MLIIFMTQGPTISPVGNSWRSHGRVGESPGACGTKLTLEMQMTQAQGVCQGAENIVGGG